MANDPVQQALDDSRRVLASANKFTRNVTDPGSTGVTNAFAPPKPPPAKIPQAREAHEAPYSLKRELDSKAQNVEQYVNAQKQ